MTLEESGVIQATQILPIRWHHTFPKVWTDILINQKWTSKITAIREGDTNTDYTVCHVSFHLWAFLVLDCRKSTFSYVARERKLPILHLISSWSCLLCCRWCTLGYCFDPLIYKICTTIPSNFNEYRIFYRIDFKATLFMVSTDKVDSKTFLIWWYEGLAVLVYVQTTIDDSGWALAVMNS